MRDSIDVRAKNLCMWLETHDQATREATLPKAIQYGSVDLELMGQALEAMMPQLNGKIRGTELAIQFYALGKLARLVSGYAEGIVPDVDSWHDLEIYSKMAQKVRETGDWI